MNINDYLDFSMPDAIRVKGHRIGLEHIVRQYKDGHSPEEIASIYPTLSLVKIYVAIAYYMTNRVTIDQYMQRIDEKAEAAYRAARCTPSPLTQRLQTYQQQTRQAV